MAVRGATLISLLFAFVLGLTGCGGGGGGSGDRRSTSDTSTLSGRVVDPAIAGASVELRGADGTALASVVRSDGNGRFSLRYSGSPSSGLIISRGGVDQATGYSFSGLTLKAPVPASGSIYVSPLSSLVVARMDSTNLSATAAASALANELGLAADLWLSDPTQNTAAQLLAVRLSLLAQALRNEAAPFAALSEALTLAGGDLNTAIGQLAADAQSSLTPALLANTQTLLTALDNAAADTAPTTPAAAIALINHAGLEQGIRRFLEQQEQSISEEGISNIRQLAAIILQASGGKGVAPEGAAIANLLRYVLRTYAIDPTALATTTLEVPTALASDPQIATLVTSTVIDPSQPLLSATEVGDDNAKRLAYFYSSSLSPYYQAERLMDGVLDDLIADPVFTAIAEGQAKAGLLDQALLTLRTRIFQALERARASRLIAVALAESGQMDQAEDFFGEARDQLLRYLDTRGEGVLTADDAAELNVLSRSANEFGFTDIAQSLLTPIDAFIAAQGGPTAPYTTAYGRVLVAVNSMASAQVGSYLAGVSTRDEALRIVDLYRTFVDNTGYQTTTNAYAIDGRHYKVKASAYSNLAEYYYYLELDPSPFIDTLFGMDHYSADPYIKNVAFILGDAGRIDEYLTRANAIDTVSASTKDSALLAIRRYAALKALQDGGDFETITAELLAYYPEDLDDQANAMTWNTVNKSTVNEGWAALLLRQDESYRNYGKIMLDRFRDLVQSDAWSTTYINSPTQIGRAGCAKAVNGYAYYGFMEDALDAYDWCFDRMANGYAWTTPQSKAQALVYLRQDGLVDQLDDADTKLNAIATEILAISIADPNDRIIYQLSASGIAAAAGNASLASSALALAQSALVELPATTAAEQEDRIETALEVAAAHAAAWNIQRSRIGTTGQLPDATTLQILNDLLQQVQSQAVDIQNRIAALASADARAEQYEWLVMTLAAAKAYDQAKTIATLPELPTGTRHTLLGIIAALQAIHSDFPLSPFASRDLDGDGRPDFMDPTTASGTNLLSLDDDIDGDGCPDSTDLTPFYAAAQCEG